MTRSRSRLLYSLYLTPRIGPNEPIMDILDKQARDDGRWGGLIHVTLCSFSAEHKYRLFTAAVNTDPGSPLIGPILCPPDAIKVTGVPQLSEGRQLGIVHLSNRTGPIRKIIRYLKHLDLVGVRDEVHLSIYGRDVTLLRPDTLDMLVNEIEGVSEWRVAIVSRRADDKEGSDLVVERVL